MTGEFCQKALYAVTKRRDKLIVSKSKKYPSEHLRQPIDSDKLGEEYHAMPVNHMDERISRGASVRYLKCKKNAKTKTTKLVMRIRQLKQNAMNERYHQRYK